MKKLVAIGGGTIRKATTRAIDQEIIRLSGKKNPKFLFIPTASSDDSGYCQVAQSYFGKYLGCTMDELLLLRERPSEKEIKTKILTADIIYVGGGNALKMMRTWRRLGIDHLLHQAYERGIVLAGLSAGSLCWFDSGHSDSLYFYHPQDWRYINVRGLGFFKGINCPHYDSETLGKYRKDDFHALISKIGGVGIALDDNCAVEFVDDHYRIITSQPDAGAYRVYKTRGTVISERIEQKNTYSPLAELYR